MRLSATVLRAGLSGAAAVLLLTGCSGSGDDPAAGSTAAPATSSSAAASTSTSGEDVQAFCTEAQAAFTRVTQAFGSATDPANVSAALDQGVAAFDEVQPPAEITSDWSSLREGLAGLRDAVAGTDVSTPEGQSALRDAVTTFQDDAAGPQQDVEQFLTANCDGLSGTPTPAPSS